jgi:hypothetical protein
MWFYHSISREGGVACPVSGSMCRGLESGKIVPLSFQIVEGLDAENVNQQLDKYRDALPYRNFVSILEKREIRPCYVNYRRCVSS